MNWGAVRIVLLVVFAAVGVAFLAVPAHWVFFWPPSPFDTHPLLMCLSGGAVVGTAATVLFWRAGWLRVPAWQFAKTVFYTFAVGALLSRALVGVLAGMALVSPGVDGWRCVAVVQQHRPGRGGNWIVDVRPHDAREPIIGLGYSKRRDGEIGDAGPGSLLALHGKLTPFGFVMHESHIAFSCTTREVTSAGVPNAKP